MTNIVRNKIEARDVFVTSVWPREIVERVDAARKKMYMSRSGFILKSIVEHMNEQQEELEGTAEGGRKSK